MKLYYETFVYYDVENHYSFYNSNSYSIADFKKIYLNRDFLNRIMTVIKNEYEFEKYLQKSFLK